MDTGSMVEALVNEGFEKSSITIRTRISEEPQATHLYWRAQKGRNILPPQPYAQL
jgi:hypothetical protein